jgi:UDP-glucose 4-epimerase
VIPRRVLVTGGAGFIGSAVTAALLAAGHRVTVYDYAPAAGWDRVPPEVAAQVTYVQGDVRDMRELRQVLRDQTIQVVSHQAGQLDIPLSAQLPAHDLDQNTVGTLVVLRACRDAGVRRVIVASSACVYGDQRLAALTESIVPQPVWEYGVSKLAAEGYARIARERDGLNVACLRYGTVYGPWEWYGRALTVFVKRALRGEPPVIFGQGLERRDLVYVDDVAALNVQLVESERPFPGPVYNVGTGLGTSIVNLALCVCAVSGRRGIKPVVELVAPGQLSAHTQSRRNYPDVWSMVLSPQLAHRDFGWVARTSVAQGVDAMYRWAVAHPQFWGP